MAKKSMIAREKKRALLSKKYQKARLALKETILSVHSSEDERAAAETKLQHMPRDASLSRRRFRCRLCGRSRAYNRLTGLCRIHMRHAVMNGFVPGMHKASW